MVEFKFPSPRADVLDQLLKHRASTPSCSCETNPDPPFDKGSRLEDLKLSVLSRARELQCGCTKDEDPALWDAYHSFLTNHVSLRTFAAFDAHAVDLGPKVVNGRRTKTLALRFYVQAKQPAHHLTHGQAIPKTISYHYGEKNVSIETDVLVSSRPRLNSDGSLKQRPLPGGTLATLFSDRGFMCENPNVTCLRVATLGGWVWDLDDQQLALVANEHFVRMKAGCLTGENVFQTEQVLHKSDPLQFKEDIIGSVRRMICMNPDVENDADAAVIAWNKTTPQSSSVLDIGPAVFAIATPFIGQKVEMFGGKSGLLKGTIASTTMKAKIADQDLPAFMIKDCIQFEWETNPAANGDSGAIVFDRTANSVGVKPAVGLYWGNQNVSNGKGFGIASKMSNVFARLNLTTICDGLFGNLMDEAFSLKDDVIKGLGLGARTARRLEQILNQTARGRVLSSFVRDFRVQLIAVLIRDVSLRQRVVRALRPLVAGARSARDVLAHQLTLQEISSFIDIADSMSDARMLPRLTLLKRMATGAQGATLFAVFGLDERFF